MIHKVHVSNNSKHDGKDTVKQQEVEKIHSHFSNNLDKWPDAFIELKNQRNSYKQANNHDSKIILELEDNMDLQI
jgi:hypothetical protein